MPQRSRQWNGVQFCCAYGPTQIHDGVVRIIGRRVGTCSVTTLLDNPKRIPGRAHYQDQALAVWCAVNKAIAEDLSVAIANLKGIVSLNSERELVIAEEIGDGAFDESHPGELKRVPYKFGTI